MKKFNVFYRSLPSGFRNESEVKDVEVEHYSSYGAAINARSHRSDIDYIISVR